MVNAVRRPLTAKAKALRRQGYVPAVLYGAHVASLHVSIPEKELLELLDHVTRSTPVEVKVDGKETYHVFLKEIQVHPITEKFLHLDLYVADPDRPLEMNVPVRVVGTARGIKDGGILEVLHNSIPVQALPAKMPPRIELDVSELGVGQAILVKDVPWPEGVVPLLPRRRPRHRRRPPGPRGRGRPRRGGGGRAGGGRGGQALSRGDPRGLRAVVGLGNVGPEYAPSRHNVGFWVIERLLPRAPWRRRVHPWGGVPRLRGLPPPAGHVHEPVRGRRAGVPCQAFPPSLRPPHRLRRRGPPRGGRPPPRPGRARDAPGDAVRPRGPGDGGRPAAPGGDRPPPGRRRLG